jgi:hypothetical protein
VDGVAPEGIILVLEEEIRRQNAASPHMADVAVNDVQPGSAEPATKIGRVEFDVLEVVGKGRLADEIVHGRIALPGSATSAS